MANNIQDQVLELVVKKGMTEADAIAEVESILRAKIPDHIRSSIRETLDSYQRAKEREGELSQREQSGLRWAGNPHNDPYPLSR